MSERMSDYRFEQIEVWSQGDKTPTFITDLVVEAKRAREAEAELRANPPYKIYPGPAFELCATIERAALTIAAAALNDDINSADLIMRCAKQYWELSTKETPNVQS